MLSFSIWFLQDTHSLATWRMQSWQGLNPLICESQQRLEDKTAGDMNANSHRWSAKRRHLWNFNGLVYTIVCSELVSCSNTCSWLFNAVHCINILIKLRMWRTKEHNIWISPPFPFSCSLSLSLSKTIPKCKLGSSTFITFSNSEFHRSLQLIFHYKA